MKKTLKNKRPKKTQGPTAESIRREKAKARELRQTQWWQNQLSAGVCHYCGKTFSAQELTLDHIVPVARGGKSTRGNVVPACKPCNSDKKYYTPAELILRNKMNANIQF